MDLGQASDYTAWAIVETVAVPTGKVERVTEAPIVTAFRHAPGRPRVFERPKVRVEHRLRHLERVRGVSYPEIVARTGAIVRELNALALTEAPPPADPYTQRTPEPPQTVLAVDATGVGAPVVDLLRAANLPAWLRPVTITGGDTATKDGAGFRVPKRDLAAALAVVLESGRLKWPKSLPLREILEAELRAFHVKVAASGHDSYGASGAGEWRERPHDDAVLAVALAVWVAEFAGGVRQGG